MKGINKINFEMNEIRLINKNDIPDLKKVLESIELFPSEMLDELISDYLNNPNSQDIWFTALENTTPIALGFCAPEKLTDGTYNLYSIGVRSDIQEQGVGSKMMNFIENYLKENGNRILIVETSGTKGFEKTRKFYSNLNYIQEAVIRDFWKDGDDKVIFWKKLN